MGTPEALDNGRCAGKIADIIQMESAKTNTRVYKFCWFSVALFITTFSAYAQSNKVGQLKAKARLKQFVDSMIKPLIDSSKIAGIAVGVMRNDSILLSESYGYADLEFNVPLPSDASFELGSITKQFTAVAVMQLAEKGAIKLDDHINKYLPIDFKDDRVTIRQLLNHTSGIKEAALGDLIYKTSSRDTILKLVANGSFDFKPGTAMVYNNTGYNILGLLIEKVSGQTYGDYLKENIFLKAGMTNTYMSDLQTIRRRRAHGYNNINKDGKLTRAEQPYFYWTFSAGALSSTMADLFRWSHALHKTQSVLKKKTYNEFIQTGFLDDGSPLRYAKGLQVLDYKGYRVIGHGGSGSGVLCDFRYFPDQDLTIITLQNTFRRVSESDITYAIADKLLASGKVEIEEFPGDLALYKGKYKGLLEITVDVIDARLVMKRNWQTSFDTLTYVGHQKWSFANDLYSFKLENGKIKEMHWDVISAYIILRKEE